MHARKASGTGSRGALLLSLAAAAACAGCGPAAQTGQDAEMPGAAANEAQTIYVVVAEQGPAPEDAWIPPEDAGENPFDLTRTWLGDYDCPQGNTDMTLRVLHVRGRVITAVFEFNHVESGAAGKFLMAGSYDEQTRAVAFTPGAWLVQPANYVSVGMSGDVSVDGSLFAGRIDHPSCGAFRLRPAR